MKLEEVSLCTWCHYKCATLSERDTGPSGINRCHNVDRSMSNHVEYLILIVRELSSSIISSFYQERKW